MYSSEGSIWRAPLAVAGSPQCLHYLNFIDQLIVLRNSSDSCTVFPLHHNFTCNLDLLLSHFITTLSEYFNHLIDWILSRNEVLESGRRRYSLRNLLDQQVFEARESGDDADAGPQEQEEEDWCCCYMQTPSPTALRPYRRRVVVRVVDNFAQEVVRLVVPASCPCYCAALCSCGFLPVRSPLPPHKRTFHLQYCDKTKLPVG